MLSVTLQEAQANLSHLLATLAPGQELTITEQGQPLAQLKKAEPSSWPCKAGSAAGTVWMSDDFDSPLEVFKEYME